MAWLSTSVLSKKHLRDDDHKDKPTLDRTPAMHGGSRKVELARRPNAWSQNDGLDPRDGVRTRTKNNISKTKNAFSYQFRYRLLDL